MSAARVAGVGVCVGRFWVFAEGGCVAVFGVRGCLGAGRWRGAVSKSGVCSVGVVARRAVSMCWVASAMVRCRSAGERLA